MNAQNTNAGGWDASDLRKKLNGEILDRFPQKIRKLLLPFENGDLLRLPTEKEIFGSNPCGEDEPESVSQWKPMKQRKNRIASQGLNGGWEWYWLQNRVPNSAACFAACAIVSGSQPNICTAAGRSLSPSCMSRPDFLSCIVSPKASFEAGGRRFAQIKNPISAPACQVRNDEDEQEG